MPDLRDLYQEVILDHNRKPRNFEELADANHHAEGHNPLCGDSYTVYVKVNDDGVIERATFTGSGCAISKAAASMMTARVKGKTVAQAEQMVEEFREMLTGHLDADGDHHLGHLTVFQGVSRLPQRIKCAVLPWHALNAALHDDQAASTEGEHDVWKNDES